MGKDLGTYHFKITAGNGEVFIHKINTGARYTHGSASNSPATASRISPLYENEEDLVKNTLYMFSEDGNSGCDCNMGAFIAQSKQEADPNMPCAETLTPTRIVMLRPDCTEQVIKEQLR